MMIWVQRFEETGRFTVKPSGGGASPLEQHAEFLLGLIVDQPDLTLDEIVAAMRKRRIAGSRGAVWRFFARRNISFKKLCTRRRKREDVTRARRRWMCEQGMFDPARLVFIDETCTNTGMLRLRGRTPRGSGSLTNAPHGHWERITFVGGLRQRGMTAPFVLKGAMNGPMFLAYVKQCLVPILKRAESIYRSQGRRRRGGHRSSGRDVDLSSEVFAGPHPDRAGLQQTQGASAQGDRAYDFCGSCVGSVALLSISARKNAGTSFALPATLEHHRNSAPSEVAGRRLAEVGYSTNVIASISGHATLRGGSRQTALLIRFGWPGNDRR